MAYRDIVTMAGSRSLIERVAACAAAKSLTQPLAWAESNIWQVAAHGTLSDAWATAEANKTVNVNPDTGARTDVVSDAMIEAAVDAVAGLGL